MLTRLLVKKNALRLLLAALFVLPFLAGTVGNVAASDGNPGAVYTMTNSSTGNAIVVYNRGADGSLITGASFSTGGLGTSANLGSQNAIQLSADHHWLFTVNAGSNDVSVFAVHSSKLNLVDRESSHGSDPISLTVSDSTLYVLNAGNGGNISGFRIGNDGHLSYIPGSSRFLSNGGVGAAASPEEIGFSPNGNQLVVTEKGSGKIDTYAVNNSRAANPVVNTSAGAAPYGFGFGSDNTLVVSEAAASSASSYRLSDKGLKVISASIVDTQAAACWLVVTGNGKYAYAANAASGTISGYRISDSGKLSLLTPGGVNGVTGANSHPVDMSFAGHDQFLYVLASGNTMINAFKVNADGSLVFIASYSSPAAASGLASR